MLAEHKLLHETAITVTGKTITENCKDATNWNEEVIRPVEKPLVEHGGIAVLRGNLAPDGAVLKPSAASASPDEAPGTCGRVPDHRANTMSGFWTLISTLTRIP